VLLDEFAFHADSRKIWAALFPVISAPGLKLRVVSTPNGKGNKFYEIMTDTSPDSPWSRHVVDIYQAVKDGLPRDIEMLKRGLRDADAWAQEYELQWLDEASAWLSYDLINAVEHDHAGDPTRFAKGHCYIGNDIAARNDLWVAWVWERVGDVLWTREIRTLRRKSFREQDQVLDELVARYNPLRISMDQTGMGEKPVEDAMRRYGSSRVEGVLFTGDSKQHMANVAKQAFEDRKVRIPLGDEAIRADLHSLRKVTTPAGNIRFDVEGGDGHADRAWAAFLGLYAASNAHGMIEWTPAPPRASRWDGSADDDHDNRASIGGAW
jgi:phage FluMu gp28-like protein